MHIRQATADAVVVAESTSVLDPSTRRWSRAGAMAIQRGFGGPPADLVWDEP